MDGTGIGARRTALWVAGLLGCAATVLAVAGCLDFDQQTAYIEHDQANDRLVVVLNYYGLYADSESETYAPSLAAQAREQLAEAVGKHTVALAGNWPFTFPLDKMRERAASPSPEGDMLEDMRRDLLTLLDRIEVLNAGFYTDLEGRLCGAQVVVVSQLSETLPLADSLINRAVLHTADEPPEDADNRALWEACVEAARAGHSWLRLDGHSLTVTVTVPEPVFARGRQAFVEDTFGADDDAALHLRQLAQVFAGPWLVWHEDGLMRVKLGYRSEPSSVVLKPREEAYTPNLVGHVRDTYGLSLDANLARYLADPDAPAETEAERAAKLMAPRLPWADRARVLGQGTVP